MVILKYIVDKVDLKQMTNYHKYIVPIGNQSYASVQIVFKKSDEWSDFDSFFVQIKHGYDCFNLPLDKEFKTVLPNVLVKGNWNISVFAISSADSTRRLVTDCSTFLAVDGYSGDGIVPEAPEDDYYAKLYEKMLVEAEQCSQTLEECLIIKAQCIEALEKLRPEMEEYCKEIVTEQIAEVTYTKEQLDEIIPELMTTEDVDKIINNT